MKLTTAQQRTNDRIKRDILAARNTYNPSDVTITINGVVFSTYAVKLPGECKGATLSPGGTIDWMEMYEPQPPHS